MRTPYWCSRCAETPAVTVGPPFVGPTGAGPRLHCWRAVSRRTLRQAVVATSAVRARRLTGKLHAAAGRRGESHGCGVVLCSLGRHPPLRVGARGLLAQSFLD